jgi:lyso-ornithine lipid O-acyltransferase
MKVARSRRVQSEFMRWAKLAAIVSLWTIFSVFVVLVHLWISVLRLPNRWEIISRLTCSLTFLLRTILNIKVTVVGDEGQLESGGCVITSNHLGYIDGFVLGSLFPVVFVSKREVKKWPVIGLWMTLCGTIFINRQKKDQVALLVAEMTRKLREGANILLFPEGRATNGERMLAFQTAPLAAPLRNRSIILPVTLVYKCVDDKAVSQANRDWIYCYDDMDFVPHFWKLLSLRSIEATVTVQPKIECSRYEDNSAGRKRLALDCYSRVLGRRANLDLSQEDEQRSMQA